MQRSIFLLLLFVFSANAGFAQVKKIVTDVNGNFEIVVEVGEDALVRVNPSGEIIDREVNGNVYYNGPDGKVSTIGVVNFYYNGPSGKVSNIGGVNFYYNGPGGKVSNIGGTYFYYNGPGGKLSSGNTSFIDNGISFRMTVGN